MGYSGVTIQRAGKTVTINGTVSGGGAITVTASSLGTVPNMNAKFGLADPSTGVFQVQSTTVKLTENGSITLTASGGGGGGATTSISLPVTTGVVTIDAITSANFHTTSGETRQVDVTVHTSTSDPLAGSTAIGAADIDVQFHLTELPAYYPAYTEQFATNANGNTTVTLTLSLGPDDFWAIGRTLQALFLDENSNQIGSGTTTVTPGRPSITALASDSSHTNSNGVLDLRVTGTVASSYCALDGISVTFVGRLARQPLLGGQWYRFIPWNFALTTADGTGAFAVFRGVGSAATERYGSANNTKGTIGAYGTDWWGNRCLTRMLTIGDNADLVSGLEDLNDALEILGGLAAPLMPGMRPPSPTRPPPGCTKPTPNPLPGGHQPNGRAPDGGPLTGWEPFWKPDPVKGRVGSPGRSGKPATGFDPRTDGPDVDLGHNWPWDTRNGSPIIDAPPGPGTAPGPGRPSH